MVRIARGHAATRQQHALSRTSVDLLKHVLKGWKDASTWGEDSGQLYAQLTRNGGLDNTGPEIWITPPLYPAVHSTADLADVIARATACGQEAVLRGMATGAAVAGVSRAERQRFNLPD
jgi:hypothetical protein